MDGQQSQYLPAAVESSLPATLRPALVSTLTVPTVREVTTTPGTPVLLCPASSPRIAFIVLRGPLQAGTAFVSPDPRANVYGVPITGPGGFAIVTRDVWFSIAGNAWYIDSQNVETVLVYDLIRTM